jgi:hypothetical protein
MTSSPSLRLVRLQAGSWRNPLAQPLQEYGRRVLDVLRAGGELITTSEIGRISPLAHQHIHLYGHYPFDPATRPAGHRPLRTPAAPAAPAPKTLNRV